MVAFEFWRFISDDKEQLADFLIALWTVVIVTLPPPSGKVLKSLVARMALVVFQDRKRPWDKYRSVAPHFSFLQRTEIFL